jgi:hypothetical protein
MEQAVSWGASPAHTACCRRAGHRRLLELFATWHVQRRLNSLADRGPLTSEQVQQARNEIRLATAFLDHLAERGRTLAESETYQSARLPCAATG